MKKNYRMRILALALSAFVVMSSGCNAVENIKSNIEKMRCEHQFDVGEVIKNATCEEMGEKLLTCTLCGATETEEISATGHTWQKVDAIAPTCTQVGYIEGIVCVTCHEEFIIPTEIPATGHSIVTDEGCSPTCTETGLTDGSHCTVCSTILTAQEEISATGHTFVRVAGKAATCMETGLTDGQACETCGVTLVAQEEVALAPCADEDNNGLCDRCEKIMPLLEGSYIEEDIAVGEKVAGNRYRIYFIEYTGLPSNAGFKINEDCCITYCTSYTKVFFSVSSYDSPEKMDSYVLITDTYIDFYIPLGLSFNSRLPDSIDVFTVTEDTVIVDIGNVANVKRLVVSE